MSSTGEYINKARARLIYGLVTVILVMLVLTGVNYWLVAYKTHESERKWCAIIVALDDAYRATPPKTDIGKNLAQQFVDLRQEFGCEKYHGGGGK